MVASNYDDGSIAPRLSVRQAMRRAYICQDKGVSGAFTKLNLTDHPDQALYGLLVGWLVLIGGGIGLALEDRLRRPKGYR
jgi:hypothetical protein